MRKNKDKSPIRKVTSKQITIDKLCRIYNIPKVLIKNT